MNGASGLGLGALALLPLLSGFPTLGLPDSVLTLREKGPSMLRIAGGEAWLGSSPAEVLEAASICALEPLGQRCTTRIFENELERRRVEVKSFWLDRHEVTVAEYERCVALGQCQAAGYGAGGERFARADYPVSFVSFVDAQSYCRFRRARLPSEAEFERAARGRDGRRYPWGNLYNGHLLNHGRLGVLENDPADGYAELAPVGSFPEGRSPEGVLDLAGNVAEWQQDPYRERSTDAAPDDTPSAPRVVRGGSFLNGAAFVRGAARERVHPATRRPDIGLRCARSAQESRPWKILGSSERLALPIHGALRFVLVRPHYPENLGACARALKTMGFSELALVRPSRLCVPEHEMAFKMAVKAWDVLAAVRTFDDIASSIADCQYVVATTARRGVSGVFTPRELGRELVGRAARGERSAILFGNEKTGLSREEVELATASLRIPMAADQPSINLAQAMQVVAYELFVAALEARA
ncbi:MAG: SUMF1/EgtB/PvdO family nonheme iron enzyme [Polyangiaceae bacterium]